MVNCKLFVLIDCVSFAGGWDFWFFRTTEKHEPLKQSHSRRVTAKIKQRSFPVLQAHMVYRTLLVQYLVDAKFIRPVVWFHFYLRICPIRRFLVAMGILFSFYNGDARIEENKGNHLCSWIFREVAGFSIFQNHRKVLTSVVGKIGG